jgi:hypothetical protein
MKNGLPEGWRCGILNWMQGVGHSGNAQCKMHKVAAADAGAGYLLHLAAARRLSARLSPAERDT